MLAFVETENLKLLIEMCLSTALSLLCLTIALFTVYNFIYYLAVGEGLAEPGGGFKRGISLKSLRSHK